MSLKVRTARNIGYIGLVQVLGMVVSTIVLLVLARLLDSSDFGTLAIGLVVLNALNNISDLGISSALIHRQNGSRRWLSTGFVLRFLLSLAAYLVIFFTVPFWAPAFGSSSIVAVVRVMSLIILITSFGFGSLIKLTMDLDFRKISIAQAVQTFAFAGMTVALAFRGMGYWAVVYGHIFSNIVMVAVLWHFAPWDFGWTFDRKIGRWIIGYGKHIFGSALVIFAITNLDNVIVGAAFGIAVLGYYDMAYRWGTIAATQFTHVVNRVMFPTYSRIRDEPGALSAAYLKTLHYVSLLAMPLAIGLIAIAPEFIEHVLSPKWDPSLGPLMVLCIFGLLRSISANSGSVFKAVGRPDTLLKISSLSLVMKVALILLFIHLGYGIMGVAVAVTGSAVLITYLNVLYSCRYTSTRPMAVAKAIAPAAASALMMALVLMAVKHVLTFPGAVYVVFLMVLGMAVYFGILRILSPATFREAIGVARSILRGRKGRADGNPERTAIDEGPGREPARRGPEGRVGKKK